MQAGADRQGGQQMVEGAGPGLLADPAGEKTGNERAGQHADHGQWAVPADPQQVAQRATHRPSGQRDQAVGAVGGDERARFRLHQAGRAMADDHQQRAGRQQPPGVPGGQPEQRRAAHDRQRRADRRRADIKRPRRAGIARPGGTGRLGQLRHCRQQRTRPPAVPRTGAPRRSGPGSLLPCVVLRAGTVAADRVHSSGGSLTGEGTHMIEVRGLTKRFGDKVAVDHLSFSVEPGRVTGFLGPNGAGKSTTMRLILGLDRPQSGTATIDGKRYNQLPRPLETVGALLEAKAMHTGRSAYNHLLFLAQSQGLPARRVDEVLALVGLTPVAHKRTGGYSLGMSQRVGIASALLGNPPVLVLDEPVNGLDPEGSLWVRNLMKQLAAEGRTIFVSSHLMNEMAVTADHLIVIGKGKLIADSPTQEFIERSSERSVLVRSPQADRLSELITKIGR